MKRCILISILLSSCGILCAQQAPDPGHLFSSDLIAWSSMQQPQSPEQQPGHQQPTPDPNSETQPAPNPAPSHSPGTAKSSDQSASQGETQAAQAFVGTVSKQADNFVLRVSASTSYKLDNQSQVQQYEGQRVRVTGTLEPSINLIHVDRIEPIS